MKNGETRITDLIERVKVMWDENESIDLNGNMRARVVEKYGERRGRARADRIQERVQIEIFAMQMSLLATRPETVADAMNLLLAAAYEVECLAWDLTNKQEQERARLALSAACNVVEFLCGRLDVRPHPFMVTDWSPEVFGLPWTPGERPAPLVKEKAA